MKTVQINSTCGVGSTGKICVGISKVMTANNIENYIFFGSKTNGYPLGIQFADDRYIKIQALKSRIKGNFGFNSKRLTLSMIDEFERLKPDIVHLHNIHSHNGNLEMLFSYFKEKRIKLIWTFHDCWAFTGYCTYFDLINCNRWKSACSNCPQKKKFSWFLDGSKQLFDNKKRLFTGLDLVIVTPSQWLADLVRQSFLREYTVKVINNGIDLNVFRPTKSEFKKKYGLEGKKIILGVSFGWEQRKGLDVFINLANTLSEHYRIVLVGTDDETDKQLPNNVISIHRTQNQNELAEIYSAADVFVNPTREDNFPTVNIEALACGTPVITFNAGGSAEMVDDTCGSVVECDDVRNLKKEIIRVCTEQPFSEEQCVNKARKFDNNEIFKKYLKLYERVIATRT